MRKFNIKSIILGIGIGIIITSFISIIYLAGNDFKEPLSNEEIIKRAQQLGMVKADDTAKDVITESGQNDVNSVIDDVYKSSGSSGDKLKTTKISD